MGLRIIRNRPLPDAIDLRMVEWETLLARDAKRWADWRLTDSEKLKATVREKVLRNHAIPDNMDEHLVELLRVETGIKQLQNISQVHGQKATDSQTLIDLL